VRRIGRLATVAVVIAGFVLAGGNAAAGPGTPSNDPGTPSIDEVYAQVGAEVNRASADVVVMIDVSADMDPARYERVKESLTGYFAGLAPVDQVTLIPFADAPTTVITQRVGQTPGEFVNLLPDAPGSGKADVGAALDSAITTLHRPDAPGLATVLLLTAGPDAGGTDWRALKRSTRGLRQGISAYEILLDSATAAPRLTKVWSRATVLPATSVGELPAALGEVRDAARKIKARNLLAGDVQKPLVVTWPLYGGIPHGTSVTDVEIRSTLKFVPLTLSGVVIAADNPDVTVSVPPGPFLVPPGAKLHLPVTARWDAGPRRAWPFYTVNGRTELDLTAVVTSPWDRVLDDDLNLELQTTLPYDPMDRDLSAQRGSFWYWLSAIVLLAVLTEIFVWWWRHPPEKRRRNRVVTVAGTSFTWQEDEMERTVEHAGSA
jgi:VWA domain-containing protein